MWKYVGIIRVEKSLARSLKTLAIWQDRRRAAPLSQQGIELKNMLTVAQLITLAAKLRKGSIGAHYREDYPKKGKGWKAHLVLGKERTTVCTEPAKSGRLPDGLVHYGNCGPVGVNNLAPRASPPDSDFLIPRSTTL